MKTRSKVLLLIMSAMALVIATIFGTLAYLTDEDVVTNTFTVGNIEIVLDELDVDENGVAIPDANPARVDKNEYHLIPNHTYIKDPTVTVLKGSDESYVRMMVTFNFSKELDDIFAPQANLMSIFHGHNSANWALHEVTENTDENTRTYEFRYNGDAYKGSKDGTVAKTDNDILLDPLFQSFTLPNWMTKEDLATLVEYKKDDKGGYVLDENGDKIVTKQFDMTIEAHAIQADGFANADAAWDAFDDQPQKPTTATPIVPEP